MRWEMALLANFFAELADVFAPGILRFRRFAAEGRRGQVARSPMKMTWVQPRLDRPCRASFAVGDVVHQELQAGQFLEGGAKPAARPLVAVEFGGVVAPGVVDRLTMPGSG